ncbi:hypothetical protein EJ110_NYTH56979 [Nymphaea thermarum]|nr:hypothetical protein EJ110_NYTH56979 [Nymphaea thermarum]
MLARVIQDALLREYGPRRYQVVYERKQNRKGKVQSIREDCQERAWGQAQFKEGGSDIGLPGNLPAWKLAERRKRSRSRHASKAPAAEGEIRHCEANLSPALVVTGVSNASEAIPPQAATVVHQLRPRMWRAQRSLSEVRLSSSPNPSHT